MHATYAFQREATFDVRNQFIITTNQQNLSTTVLHFKLTSKETMLCPMKIFLLTLLSFVCFSYAEDFLRGALVHTIEQHRLLQTLGNVLYFRLVNASPNPNGNITIIEKIRNGTIVDLSKYPSNQELNIEAVTNGTIGSLQFRYNNEAPYKPEARTPYSMCGDNNGRFIPCPELKLNGKHSVTAIPWTGIKANGTIGKPLNIFFQVQNGGSTPTPPIPAPTPVRPVPVPVPVRPVPVPVPVRPVPVPVPVRPVPVPVPVWPVPVPVPVRPVPVPVPVRPVPVPVPVRPVPVSGPSIGQWIEVDRNATEIIARHEACFILVGRKAYLLGGRYREDNAVDIYDPVSRKWSKGKAPPVEIHHTQCIAVDGKIWIASSWTGNFPREKNNEFIYVR